MSEIDLDKQRVLNTSIVNDVLPTLIKRGATYNYYENGVYSSIVFNTEIKDFNEKRREYANKGLFNEFDIAVKLNNATYQRGKRASERVKRIIEFEKVVFLTLTFNDETLRTTTLKQRRTYVSRYLKKNSLVYLANIDYGSKNHREHYHAVCAVSDKVVLDDWRKYGNINAKWVKIDKDNKATIKKLAKYVAKLSNHSIKETTKRSYLLYSR